MDKKQRNTLLIIAGAGFAVAGIMFLLAAIFDEDKSNWVLASSLLCILLSNLFNIVRIQINKKSRLPYYLGTSKS